MSDEHKTTPPRRLVNPMTPEDITIAHLRKALGRIAAIPRVPGDDGQAQKIAREALAR